MQFSINLNDETLVSVDGYHFSQLEFRKLIADASAFYSEMKIMRSEMQADIAAAAAIIERQKKRIDVMAPKAKALKSQLIKTWHFQAPEINDHNQFNNDINGIIDLMKKDGPNLDPSIDHNKNQIISAGFPVIESLRFVVTLSSAEESSFGFNWLNLTWIRLRHGVDIDKMSMKDGSTVYSLDIPTFGLEYTMALLTEYRALSRIFTMAACMNKNVEFHVEKMKALLK